MRSRLLLLVLLAGCGGVEGAKAPAADLGANAETFARAESEILRDLAAVDGRLAARAGITPREEDLRRVALAAVLAEDVKIQIVDGRLDVFSFDARDRALAAAEKKIPSIALPTDAERERDLLARMVKAERLRVADDRALPRSASALVRAIVDTWTPPASAATANERDQWLALRLGQIRLSLAAPLDVIRARELDDALDGIERAATGLRAATAELVRLRDLLAAQRPSAPGTIEAVELEQRLQAHLGVSLGLDAVSARLAAASAKTASGPASEKDGPLLFPNRQCVSAVEGSLVRSMAAPPERNAVCSLLDDPRAPLLHDHVVVAQWALDVARGTTLSDARARYRLTTRIPPEDLAHLERIAVARPITAIGAGLAAALLLDGDPKARAEAWKKLGDVPFDVAERELPR